MLKEMSYDFFRVLKLLGFPVSKARLMFSEIPFNGDLFNWQQRKAFEIFNYHYIQNNFYRNFVGEEPSRWETIPVIKRNDLKGDPMQRIPEILVGEKLYFSNTSGSSGDPLFFVRDRLSHVMTWLNVERIYNDFDISINDKQARMYGMSQRTFPKLKLRIKDKLSNRYRFNVFDLSDKALEGWIQRFKANKFRYIYGYTNSLVAFARYLKSKDLVLADIAGSLNACIVTSEVCTENDALILKEAFGVPVFNEYGSSELGVMAFKENGFWTASDGLLYFEVLDDDDNVLPDGELGYLTCTALFNRATPFIRYRIGDLAAINKKDGFTRIEQIMGSLNDMAVLPSGKRIPGISFYFVAEELIDKSDVVKEFLFRQTKEGFEFEYVAERDLNPGEFELVKKQFEKMLEKGIPLKALRVDQLRRGASGKFKHFISEL